MNIKYLIKFVILSIFIFPFKTKKYKPYLDIINKSKFVNNKLIKDKQYIPIAYALDKGYFYPTFVSILSILENSNKSCCYVIYLLLPSDGNFPQLYINKFKNLENKYINCKINIVNIDEERFEKAFTKRYPLSAYYRLLIADIVTDFNRIIYLDGDTIIFDDLVDLINLDMKDNIALGWIDNSFDKAKQFNVTIKAYITSGVILFNLKEMREKNITDKFFNFMNKYYEHLTQEDQTIINIVLHDRIDYLPAKYGIWTFNRLFDLIQHNHLANAKSGTRCYYDDEIVKALKNPGIAHYVRSKPWEPISRRHTCMRYRKIWWEYAKKSGEYENIKEYYAMEE